MGCPPTKTYQNRPRGPPRRTVQQALAGYGVITGRGAVGLRAHGWSLEEIAREWGVSKRRILAMIAREEGK